MAKFWNMLLEIFLKNLEKSKIHLKFKKKQNYNNHKLQSKVSPLYNCFLYNKSWYDFKFYIELYLEV